MKDGSWAPALVEFKTFDGGEGDGGGGGGGGGRRRYFGVAESMEPFPRMLLFENWNLT